MARPERLELPTYWFEASRSIHLSYGRALAIRISLPEYAGAPSKLRSDLTGVRRINRLFPINRFHFSARSDRQRAGFGSFPPAPPTLPPPPGLPVPPTLPPAPPL